MVRKVIKNAISIIVVSSLILCNVCINNELTDRGIQESISLEAEATIAGEILNKLLSKNYNKYNEIGIGATDNELKIPQAIHYTRNKYNNQLDLPDRVEFDEGTNDLAYAYVNGQRIDIEDSYLNGWYEEKRAIFHQHTVEGLSGNVKYIDTLGHREAIYNRTTGELVIDARDIGTYNFSSPDDAANHVLLDVKTYYRWGNTPNDTTSWLGRQIGVVD